MLKRYLGRKPKKTGTAAGEQVNYSEFIKKMGAAELPCPKSGHVPEIFVDVPANICSRRDEDDDAQLPSAKQNIDAGSVAPLLKFVFPNFEKDHRSREYLAEHAGLAPCNDTTFAINNMCLGMAPEEERRYYSTDTVQEAKSGDDLTFAPTNNVTTEFLNQMPTPNSFPHH